MSTALTVTAEHEITALGADLSAAVELAKAEKADATRKAYGTDFRLFSEWCEAKGVASLPALPETVASYLASQAAVSRPSTLGRRLAAVAYAHKLAGLQTPTDAEPVKATMRGIRRTVGAAKRRKTPAVADKVLRMAALAPDSLPGLRDRALLLLGFASAARRSEIVALDVADIEHVKGGIRVTIRKSKTDQDGEGQVIAIPFGGTDCPIAALTAWLNAAAIKSGPIFRPVNKAGTVADTRLTDKSLASIVKAYAARAGHNPDDYAGHSLRSGFLTSAAAKGASVFKMMDQSRHRSIETLRNYVRDAELLKDHAGAGLL
jgi:site-specific recombinase XerD